MEGDEDDDDDDDGRVNGGSYQRLSGEVVEITNEVRVVVRLFTFN